MATHSRSRSPLAPNKRRRGCSTPHSDDEETEEEDEEDDVDEEVYLDEDNSVLLLVADKQDPNKIRLLMRHFQHDICAGLGMQEYLVDDDGVEHSYKQLLLSASLCVSSFRDASAQVTELETIVDGRRAWRVPGDGIPYTLLEGLQLENLIADPSAEGEFTLQRAE